MTTRRGWPEPVRSACFWLWASTGARNAARTARLYQEQLPDGDLGPSPATIRRWRVEERWQEWASGDVPPLPVQHMPQWQTMWFRRKAKEIETALSLEADVLAGIYESPAVAAASLATASAVFSDPVVRALLRTAFAEPAPTPVPLTPRERRARDRLRRRRALT
jgi:hypothetical protein